jgi:restriction system protein
MTVWLVRAGRHGEREDLALDQGVAVVGWSQLPSLADVATRDEMVAIVRSMYPDAGDGTITNWVGQLFAFRHRIAIGDLVVLPMKHNPVLAIGRITGDYTYRPDLPVDARHVRTVQWLRTDLARSAVGQDLLYSLGAFLTVCEIKRNQAASRIAAMAEGGDDPGASAVTNIGAAGPEEATDETVASIDLEQVARDRLQSYIAERFAGHDLARLVEAVLRAEGFFTYRSPAGPDGGIDVLAGKGPLGLDAPRLCVQVKSGNAVDVKVVRELHGVLSTANADQGLLVAWGGVTKSAEAEARSQFFRIRVWTADDLVDALTRNYDRLPEEMQAELPLKRIWTLVLDEDAG